MSFYASVSRSLITWKPDAVMYYETLSALPAIVYKKMFKRDSRLIIHYHEYTSVEEYRHGMIVNRWLHKLERKAYPLCSWISHTNSDRMNLFVSDNKFLNIPNRHILPNYPPGKWKNETQKSSAELPLRFVYVGALSLDTMYVREFANWIVGQNGQATWDIYSGNITEDAKLFLKDMNTSLIRFQGNVNYFLLPEILVQYRIGIILYKGHIPNYIYNAPNKLFEYWACGLDVWFPKKMKGCFSLITKGTYPKIVPIDFEELGQIEPTEIANRSGFAYKPSVYYYEHEFNRLLEETAANNYIIGV
jgi:hypothetical protein